MLPTVPNLVLSRPRLIRSGVIASILLLSLSLAVLSYQGFSQTQQLSQLQQRALSLERELAEVAAKYVALQEVDQYKRNEELQAAMQQIEHTYSESLVLYETIQELEDQGTEIEPLQTQFAAVLQQLSQKEYQKSQETQLALAADIDKAELAIVQAAQERLEKLLAETAVSESPATAGGGEASGAVATNNAPPSSGYSRQQVAALGSTYAVSLIAGDLGSTRVVVDTASGQDCANDCPVLPLGDYVARNGAYAGINGSYFCPASYPSCAGKTNSFDLLVMNKDKTYFNSANNVYSTNPGVVFSDGSVRFLNAVSEWGRDTSPTGVLSNFPLLLMNGEIRYGGGSDPKHGSKGNRSFVASKGNVVYIGVVHSSTVAEAAAVLQALGLENGLNLDSGGSTALWSDGYKVGPGRGIPNAILFVAK